jgi:hypothetical protein
MPDATQAAYVIAMQIDALIDEISCNESLPADTRKCLIAMATLPRNTAIRFCDKLDPSTAEWVKGAANTPQKSSRILDEAGTNVVWLFPQNDAPRTLPAPDLQPA